MNTTRILVLYFIVSLSTTAAHGHGVPVIVDLVQNKVTVSNGIANPNGYAPMIFADGSIDAQLAHENLPGYGNVAVTDLPGFVFNDMAQHSVINLEIIPRPVQGANPLEQRVLWHWSGVSRTVASVPNNEELAIVSVSDEMSIGQQPPAPRPVFITHLEPFDIGQHVHFLAYLLDDDPSAAIGAYGVFARFLVAPYQASDPFLMVFNNGLSESALLEAALAINLAAADAVPLAGDYNANGTVDSADYVMWRKTLGSTAELAADGSGNHVVDADDYAVWRSHFGQTAGGRGTVTVGQSLALPEPSGAALAAGVVATIAIARARNRRSTACHSH